MHVVVQSSSVCSSSKILMPAIQASAKIPYVKHSLKPDGSCCCGDTGCDGPPVHVMVESSSVCTSFKIPPISQVTPTSAFVTSVTSISCRSPTDEKKMPKNADEKKPKKKLTMTKVKMKELKKNNNKHNHLNNAAGTAANGWENTQGAACKQRTLKEPPWSDL